MEQIGLNQEQLGEIINIILPNKKDNVDFAEFKAEIKRLKIENLKLQIQIKKKESTELISSVKSKLNKDIVLQMYAGEPGRVIGSEPDKGLHNWLEILLSSQQECLRTNDSVAREQLRKAKEALEKKLTKEEIQTVIGEKIEIDGLERHLNSLQQS